ncbi:hypothetical protein EIP91_005128 [Steccherinum ochraceum]|uniref:Osmotin, thaumatin-like protein n=1 Tax=Steccherinum ochraceum TaxID=92696 RepID=A0A4R0RIM8_9APHY|nr:hypothetical protein EIP91_005128 [Steccherinum ochraceum]
MLSASLVPLAFIAAVSARTFTVYNACPFTIWPAMFTDLNVGSAAPAHANGWEAAAFTAVSFSVPDNWKAGRIWARRNCNFNDPNPATQCADGGCNGGLVCDSRTGSGVPPATLAEFTLEGAGNKDFFDISLVDGYNLPLRIDNDKGCPVPECAVDLGPNCPPQYKGPFDSTGFPVGCKSACLVDPNPTNSPACCSGQYSGGPQACPSSGSGSYSYFMALKEQYFGNKPSWIRSPQGIPSCMAAHMHNKLSASCLILTACVQGFSPTDPGAGASYVVSRQESNSDCFRNRFLAIGSVMQAVSDDYSQFDPATRIVRTSTKLIANLTMKLNKIEDSVGLTAQALIDKAEVPTDEPDSVSVSVSITSAFDIANIMNSQVLFNLNDESSDS